MIDLITEHINRLDRRKIIVLVSVLAFILLSTHEMRTRFHFGSEMWKLASPYIYVSPIPFVGSIVTSLIVGTALVYFVAYIWDIICTRITSTIRSTMQSMVQTITGPKIESRTIMDRIKSSKGGVISILYTLSQVRTIPLVLAQFVTLGSLLDLPGLALENLFSRIMRSDIPITDVVTDENIEVVEHGIEEMLPAIAMVSSLSGCKIGSVNLDSFMSKMASNQRNAETLWKSLKPILTQMGILKDSQYETVLEVSRVVEGLMDHEAWLKLKIRTNTTDLLTGEGQARVEKIRGIVLTQLRRLTTITTKDLVNDKGVNDCMRRIKVIEDLLNQVDQARSTCEFRVKPVGVCIWGEKQVGKTTMFGDLRALIMEELVKSGNPAFQEARSWATWSRQCRDEFDTNYRGQQITYSDDAFQQKDNKDHLLWYSFISGTMVGTNQADLVNKGMPYTSKLVVTTCNHLPKTSVTVSDISALHARFPYTIRVIKTGNVPRGSKHDPSYSWLKLYCGPMDLMVNFEPPREGAQLPENVFMVTLPELAKKIADSMITEESFFRSRLPGLNGGSIDVIEHEENDSEIVFGFEKMANWYAEKQTVFRSNGCNFASSSMPTIAQWPGLSDIISHPAINLEKAYSDDPQLNAIKADPRAVELITNFITDNHFSFKAYNVLRQIYYKRNLPLDQVAEYVDQAIGDRQFLGGEDVDLYRMKFLNFMLYKIVSYQLVERYDESTWNEVSDWTKYLKHKRSGLKFMEWSRTLSPTVTDFITTLHEWEILEGCEEKFKEQYSHQLPLCLKGDKDCWVWSPLFMGGQTLIPMRQAVALSRGITRIVGVKSIDRFYKLDCWLQGGLIASEGLHERFSKSVKYGFVLQKSDLHLDHLESIYYCVRPTRDRALNLYHQVLQDRLNREKQAVIDARTWCDEVKSTYAEIIKRNKRVFESGMDRLIILFDSLGLPVSDYWRTVLTENAQLISYTMIALITGTILFGFMKVMQIRHAEEHSVSEKQPGKRKLQRRDVKKLIKTLPATEHLDSLTFEKTSQSDDIKIDTELLFERIDIGLEDHTTFEVIGVGYRDVGQVWGNLKNEFSPKYVDNSLVQTCEVTRAREEGNYYAIVSIKETMKLSEYEKIISRYIDSCDRVPIGEWQMDLSFTVLDDESCYVELEYVLLNANLNGELVPWKRKQLLGVDELKSALCKGSTEPLKNIVLGQEHGNDKALLEIANGVLDHNLVSLEVAREENIELPAVSKCLALASKDKIILPAHVAEKGCLYKFNMVSSTKNTGYHVAKLQSLDLVRDVAIATIVDYKYVSQFLLNRGTRPEIMTMSKMTRQFSDISRLCLSEDDMSDVFNGCDTLHYFHKNHRYLTGRTSGYTTRNYDIDGLTKKKKLVAITPKLCSELELSMPGDCGGPIFLASGRKKGALLGFYVQRSNKEKSWYSAYICKDDLHIETEEQSFDDPWAKLIINGPPRDLPKGDEIKFVGLLRKTTLPATRTSLDHWKKSPFSAEFEEQLAPGRLDAYDPAIEIELPRNQNGTKSLLMGPNSVMGKTIPNLDQELLDWCVMQITEEMAMTFRNNGYLKKVSDNISDMLEYALNGDPDNVYVTGMEVRKAAGLPWSMIGLQRKCDMIDVDPKTGKRSFKKGVEGKALRQRVTTKLVEANRGNRILSLSNSKLKDQCIKLAHVRTGRTRVFHCIPVDSIMFCAALYGPFKEAYTRSRLNCYHAVGIDPKSRDWEFLVNYLAKHPNFFDADYSNYDKYLHRQMMFAVRKIQRQVIQRIVPDSWDKAREIEELDSIDTYVVDYSTVYQTNRANKSGSYLTTIDNCIANDVYGLYAWVKATDIRSLSEYRTNVSSVAFGDDIVKSVSDTYKNQYNYKTYKKILEETGHIITPGNKDGVEVETVSLDQLQFLKRGFDQIKGRWVAPLLKRSIEGPFVWTSISNSSYEEWFNLVQEQLYEASLHGEAYYNEFRDKLKKCADTGLRSYIQILLSDTWSNTINKLFERYDRE